MSHLNTYTFSLSENFAEEFLNIDGYMSNENVDHFYTYMENIDNQIMSDIGSSKQHLLEGSSQDFKYKSIWVNHYSSGESNEIHSHQNDTLAADYVAILVLRSHEDDELVIYDEQNEVGNVYSNETGSCFVVRTDILHGLNSVNSNFSAIMFRIKI